jgi:hypothetical protein
MGYVLEVLAYKPTMYNEWGTMFLRIEKRMRCRNVVVDQNRSLLVRCFR